MGRKELILHKALELFNQHGSRYVTTNHIVEALGMSPGNLYYYFKNKEDIIFELFITMIREWESDNFQLDTTLLNPQSLALMLQKTGEFFIKYSFIHKELQFLIQNDEKLKTINLEIQAKRLQQLSAMVDFNVSEGIFRELTTNEKEFIIDMLWMGSLFWQPYLEISGQINDPQNAHKILNHFMLIHQLFKNDRAL